LLIVRKSLARRFKKKRGGLLAKWKARMEKKVTAFEKEEKNKSSNKAKGRVHLPAGRKGGNFQVPRGEKGGKPRVKEKAY